DFVIGIYCGCFMLVLYLFLLHTLSRNVLPADPTKWGGRLFSFVVRILFLVFLGLLIAQPINYFVFKDVVDNELIEFKNREILALNQRLNLKYAKELKSKRRELTSNVRVLSEIDFYDQKKN